MSFLPILLSKIKLHHVSELGVTCWVCCVCVGGCLKLSIVLKQCATVTSVTEMVNKIQIVK